MRVHIDSAQQLLLSSLLSNSPYGFNPNLGPGGGIVARVGLDSEARRHIYGIEVRRCRLFNRTSHICTEMVQKGGGV